MALPFSLNMYILHIETSTSVCSVALSRGRTVIGSIHLTEGMNHTALLTPSIDQLLQSNNIKTVDLAAVSISSGPGSYTGLRVGSSTAIGIAYSLKIPILQIPTLTSLAKAAFDRYNDLELVMPMIDARRNEVYTALFDSRLNIRFPVSSVILSDNLWDDLMITGKKVVFCGDGALKMKAYVEGTEGIIDPAIECNALNLVELAFQKYNAGKFSDPLRFVPFYLKPPNITEPRQSL